MSPGTNVFCGEPLMKATPSSTAAAAYKLEGAISASPRSIAARRFSAVSFSPSLTCGGVCAFHLGFRVSLQVSLSPSLTCTDVRPFLPCAHAPGQAHHASCADLRSLTCSARTCARLTIRSAT